MGLASLVKKGTTSYLLEVSIRSATTGQLLTGLVAADMTIKYQRQGAVAYVNVTPQTGTLGTWASGSWVESAPGIYQFGVPDAALVAGVDSVIITFKSTNSLDASALIYLTSPDFQDADDMGLTTLDVAISTRTTLGAGAVSKTLTIKSSTTDAPLDGVDVWVSTDSGGNNLVARSTTNAFGQVTFMLNNGSYYVWKRLSGYTFGNPEALTV